MKMLMCGEIESQMKISFRKNQSGFETYPFLKSQLCTCIAQPCNSQTAEAKGDVYPPKIMGNTLKNSEEEEIRENDRQVPNSPIGSN